MFFHMNINPEHSIFVNIKKSLANRKWKLNYKGSIIICILRNANLLISAIIRFPRPIT